MNKIDLIEALKEEAVLTKIEAQKVVDLFFYEMSDALKLEYRVKQVPSSEKYLEITKGKIKMADKNHYRKLEDMYHSAFLKKLVTNDSPNFFLQLY